jgi:oxalate decarboxylase/phosphoglucose isomerase-like protein (cupin superfamily)
MESRIIELKKILDDRGNLTFIEQFKDIPFSISRTYWVYDVPGGEIRGAHAFKEQKEFIVALSGSFDVVLNKGNGEQRYHMNRSYYGLYVPSMHWRFLDNFSTNSVALVLTDKVFSEEDYIWEFNDFIKMKINE